MTNLEFCRDSIHSKTTRSCLLFFSCTLVDSKYLVEKLVGTSRHFDVQRHRQLVRSEIDQTEPTDDGVVRRNVLKSLPTFPPDIYYRQEYMRKRVGNSWSFCYECCHGRILSSSSLPTSVCTKKGKTFNRASESSVEPTLNTVRLMITCMQSAGLA